MHIYYGAGNAITPTDEWLDKLLLQNVSTKGYLLMGKHMKDQDVVIKLSTDNNDEYKIYGLMQKMKTYMPNIPYVYANFSCYEKKSIVDRKFKDIKGRGICYGNKDDGQSQRIYLTVIQHLDTFVTLDDVGSAKLPDHHITSLMFQGLYTIYLLYYVFGIMHRDFNGGNILIQQTEKKTLDYKVVYSPYRFFPFEVQIGDCYENGVTYSVDTHGVRLYLIDFDQSSIYHHDYIKDYITTDIKHTIIDEAHAFITSLLSKATSTMVDKYNKVYKQCFDRIKECCLRYHDKYNGDKTPHNNNYMLYKTAAALRAYMDYVRKEFGLPFSYKI